MSNALSLAVERAVNAAETALRPLTPETTAQPSGPEAVALVAVFRAYADLMEEEFSEETKVSAKNLTDVVKKALGGGG